ncbi:MAG: alpha-L-rhamnosidase [Cyclobacteriaceae bacterium]|nr:alpha-L-rhamnosidase [Cyclobacteriaceae bacterium]
MQKSIIWILMASWLFSCQRSDNGQAERLMVELLTVPRESVITQPKPLLSWAINDTRLGALQSAYQIMLATSEKELAKGQPDVWNSGKILSDQSFSVPYAGPPLSENTVYYWKVRCWNEQDKAGKWSESQMFYTGEFSASDLKWPGESRWVQQGQEPSGRLVLENRQALRYHDIIPESVERNIMGHYFVKFEKAAFGTLKLYLEGAKDGDTLRIHLGEKLSEGPSVDRSPGGSITYKQVDLPLSSGLSDYMVNLPRQYSKYPNSQVLADHMPEVAAFRYAEIEGWNGPLSTQQVRQHALLYRFDDEAADFNSSDEALNQVWDLCKHTLKVTPFLGLYIDGTRERMPYEADAYIQQISHYCVDREFAIQRYTMEFLLFNPSWPTEWHLHMVLMAWADYMATGNTRALEKYYQEFKKKTLLPLAREDGLISTRTGKVTPEFLASIHYYGNIFRDITDWPQGTPANEEVPRSNFGSVRIEGETDRFVFSDINTVVNAFHYRNLVLMAKIAKILNKKEDEAFFVERSALVYKSFNELLLDQESGLYRDGEGVAHSSLHANMFPVAFGLAPLAHHETIKNFLKSKEMACSPYGAPYLMDALYTLGAGDYAHELLTSDSDRSWLNMINFGTTITSEAWDLKFKRNMTWNHAWGASPAYVITRKIFGIEPLEPGYRKVQIKPNPGNLQEAQLKSPSIKGAIEAAFKNEPGSRFVYRLTLPANTSARVLLPLDNFISPVVRINQKEAEWIQEHNCAVIDDISSGTWEFEIMEK